MYTNRRKVKEGISIGRCLSRIATADRDQPSAAARPSSSIMSHLLPIVLPACTHTKKREQLRFSGVAIRTWLFVASRWDPIMIRQPSCRPAFVLSIGILFSLASTAAFADER